MIFGSFAGCAPLVEQAQGPSHTLLGGVGGLPAGQVSLGVQPPSRAGMPFGVAA
jgi:hypothetical protein